MIREELRACVRWTLVGAVLGAAALGGFGLAIFGAKGLLYGALAGAAIGGVGSLLFYLNATTIL